MSKILKGVAIAALFVGAAVLTGGLSIAPGLAVGGATFTAAGVITGVTITTTAFAVTSALGASLLVSGAAAILSGVAGQLQGTPKASAAQLSRLTPSLIPATYRDIVFGNTAMPPRIRYYEPSGTDQEYFDYIVAVASHAVDSIDAIWFEDRIAWTLAGGVDAFYAGYLTAVDIRLEGTAANAITINAGARWNSSCRLTGCAYIHFRIKRTGNTTKAASPLANGLPGRVTIIGKGAKVYDPRRDSSIGGSGTHRADDQTTWQYTAGGVALGNNHALQALWYELGWKIGGKLAVGKGIPPSRLDLAAFAIAANLCDEAVALAAGGTQRRYEGGGVFNEGDQPLTVLDSICLSCSGEMTDTNGRIGMEVAHNDLGGTPLQFTDDDIVGGYAWDPAASLHASVNVVRGQFIDPSNNSLYQLNDLPEVRIASPDGIDRPAPVQLSLVQDPNRGQRIMKQLLQAAQFNGVFTAQFGPRAMAAKRGMIIQLTFSPLNFTTKYFRVKKQTISINSGAVDLVLREVDAAIYAWDREETAAVIASPPVIYDAANEPWRIKQGLDIGVSNGADVTSAVVQLMRMPAVPTIKADYTGAPMTGQLPRDLQATRTRGGANVSSIAGWSITATGCTASIGGATGVITITAIAATGKIVVTSLLDGIPLVDEFAVIKETAPPPSGGGSGGGNSATDSTIGGTSSITYGSAQGGPLTLVCGPTGVVGLSAPLTFGGSTGGATRGKWQWRISGGSYADCPAGEINSSSNATDGEPDSGYIEVNDIKGGLTSGSTYDFQLLLRRNTATALMSFSGTASAVSS